MPVVVQTPYSAHLANGVTDTFGYDFQLILATDLEVKLDGVVQSSGFTVNGVGDQAGGDVEFTSPPASNALVELTRKIPLSRSTNYPYLGALPEDQVDNDFDRIWQALQDLNYFGNTLSLKLPAGDVKAPMTLPSATSRASKFLAFDAEGGLIVSPGVADVPVSTFMATVVGATDAPDARDLLGAAAASNVREDVASAATLNLDSVTSDYLRITGTTTVPAVTLAAGQRRVAVAGGAFQLTNSASLIVQGGSDYTTTAGDLLLFFGESGGVVRVFVIQSSAAAYVALTGDQTVAGIKTFSTFPRISGTIPMARVDTGNGYGAVNTKIARFTNVVVNNGSLYADSANNGASFTAPVKGVYAISISASFSGSCTFGVTLNSSQLTTNFVSTTQSTRLITAQATAANVAFGNATTVELEAGDVVRFHSDGTAFGTVPAQFTMTRVA